MPRACCSPSSPSESRGLERAPDLPLPAAIQNLRRERRPPTPQPGRRPAPAPALTPAPGPRVPASPRPSPAGLPHAPCTLATARGGAGEVRPRGGGGVRGRGGGGRRRELGVAAGKPFQGSGGWAWARARAWRAPGVLAAWRGRQSQWLCDGRGLGGDRSVGPVGLAISGAGVMGAEVA